MSRRTRRTIIAGLLLGVLVTFASTTPVAMAKFTASTSVTSSFGSASCYYRATVQSGETSVTANGTTTVAIAAVDTSRSFLIFSTRHDQREPDRTLVRARLASATTLEFAIVQNTGTVTVNWSVTEYQCGVTVQRGTVTQTATSIDVPISSVGALSRAFVTWSKTSNNDNAWGADDPIIVEFTSTTNLQLRSNLSSSPATVWWQVVAFTDASAISVQRGTTSMASPATSTTVTLGAAVDLTKTFLLTGTRSTGNGVDIGSGLIRARLTNSTTITLDRSAANYDLTEIAWQAIQLLDGSSVQSGTSTFPSGTATVTAPLTAVPLSRTSAFASGQTGGGQNGGRTSYIADDVIGVASVGASLTSSTQLTLTRNNTSASADFAWFVVTWGIA